MSAVLLLGTVLLFSCGEDGDDSNGGTSGGNNNNSNTPEYPEYVDENRMELPEDTINFRGKQCLNPEGALYDGGKRIVFYFKTDFEYELVIAFKDRITYKQVGEIYSKQYNMLERVSSTGNKIEQVFLTYYDSSNNRHTVNFDTNYYNTSNSIYITAVDIISKKSEMCNVYIDMKLSTPSKDELLEGGCQLHIE